MFLLNQLPVLFALLACEQEICYSLSREPVRGVLDANCRFEEVCIVCFQLSSCSVWHELVHLIPIDAVLRVPALLGVLQERLLLLVRPDVVWSCHWSGAQFKLYMELE